MWWSISKMRSASTGALTAAVQSCWQIWPIKANTNSGTVFCIRYQSFFCNDYYLLLRLSEIGDSRLCQLDTVEYGRNNLYSLVIVTFIYFLTILALQIGGRYLYKRFFSERRPAPDGLAAIDDSVNVAPGSPAPGQIFRNLNGGGSHGRFGSIDAFRGCVLVEI